MIGWKLVYDIECPSGSVGYKSGIINQWRINKNSDKRSRL